MAHVNAIEGTRPVMAWGGEPFRLATYFTTDGSQDPTIGTGADHGGRISVSRVDESGAPDTYTIDFGATWEDEQAIIVAHSENATVNVDSLTADGSAGTLEIAFSGTMTSARVDVIMEVSASKAR